MVIIKGAYLAPFFIWRTNMGLFGFSGETYWFGASKSVSLFNAPDTNFITSAVQKAILGNRDIVDSILHSTGINFGASYRSFLDYSKDKSSIWKSTTGIYTTQEENSVAKLAHLFTPAGTVRKPFKEVDDYYAAESDVTLRNKVREHYVKSQLERLYNMKNGTMLGNLVTGISSDVTAIFKNFTMGPEYTVEKQPEPFDWFGVPYDQYMHDFTINYTIINSSGVSRSFSEVRSWDFQVKRRVPILFYYREGEDQIYTYLPSSAFSNKPVFDGWDPIGGFNDTVWKPEERTQLEEDKGRYFVDPVPIVTRSERASGFYGNNDQEIYDALKLLSLDFDDLYDSVMDVEKNDNTLNLLSAEVESSIFIRESDQASLKALYLTFREAKKYAYSSYERFSDIRAGVLPTYAAYTTGNKLGSAIYFNYIRRETGLSGVVGNIGEYTSRVNIKPIFQITIDDIHGGTDVDFEDSDFIIEVQRTATTYERLTVNGLHRSTKYSPPSGGNYQRIVKNLESTTALDFNTASGYEDEGLRIPLHTYIWGQMSSLEQEALAYRMMALNMQVEKKEYLEWYKTAGFLDVVQIVLVAVAIYTAGQSSWFDALVSAGSLGAAALVALEAIFYAYLTGAVLDLAINVLGENLALIAAFIALVAAAYTGNAAYVVNIGSASFSTNLLQMATLMIQAVNRKVDKDLEKLFAEQQEWEEGEDERNEQIAEIQDLLDTTSGSAEHLLDSFYDGFYFNEKETPSMFFERTIHYTNIAEPSLSFPSRFVDDALNLDNIINQGY